MTNTTYYHLNIVEGSDIVNPLTVDNPNYAIIDETMHDNAVSGVTLATEIANATVHAITRENSECAVIRFIATSEWKAGDTVTVDGVPVTALLPSGETLPDGAYVINSNVLCILTGTNMTVFAERKKTDTANDIIYNNTNVGAELDEINSNLLKKQTSGEKIYTQKDIAIAPSESAYRNATIRIDSDPANGSRAGIGFHNTGYNGCFLYLETDDNNLYLMLNNGGKFKINMTQVV